MATVAVIGGGAAGLMAAGRAHELGADVTLFEKNSKFGRKLAITGKGRCNVTNNCTPEEFLRSVLNNSRFMYSAIYNFTPGDTMAFFESRGVKLKTERGNRVFPVSDKSYDIVDALGAYASKCRIVRESVEGIVAENGRVSGVSVSGKTEPFDSVIVCTGGASYPLTGSTGDGYRFAKAVGHTVVSPRPSLIPIVTEEVWCRELQGLSLKNVAVSIYRDSQKVYSDFGEMLFTHFGVSGPMILSASAYMSGKGFKGCRMVIDLKPALDEKALDKRVLSDFEKFRLKNFDNALDELLPQKMIPVMIGLSGISPKKKVHEIGREERLRLVHLLKNLEITPIGFRPIEEAIITAGGVSVKEINPRTMESKLVSGLYFAGEVIDVDAYTGGFNLQIAFSTAVAAAEAVACN
ncbi:MAG: NAD(P)/FAD-dependent oxidoreductase [Clostridia bacterium]|nr:NAD(P)/FAD-dependent oxidoreductase [Clostridia bacterium]